MKKNRVAKAPTDKEALLQGFDRLYPYYQTVEQIEDQKEELLADRKKTLGHTYYTGKSLIIHLILGAVIWGIIWIWHDKAPNIVTGYLMELGGPGFIGLFAIWMAMIALFRKAGHAKRRELIDKQVARYDQQIDAVKRKTVEDFMPVNCRSTEAVEFMKQAIMNGEAETFKEVQQLYYEQQKAKRDADHHRPVGQQA